MGALAGIKVVEFGNGIAVGYCGALLAVCGGEVIKVEAPGRGDTVRHLPPFGEGVAAPEASGMHAFLCAGKTSITINLGQEQGQELARRLAVGADVVLEALGPGGALG